MISRPSDAVPRPWFWEGNVQATVVDHLTCDEWCVIRQADTVSREPGKDIELEREGVRMGGTVKGFPNGTPRTPPNTQARHWFTAALFDVILWRETDAGVRIGLALPNMPTYRRQASRTTWFQRAANFTFLWVDETAVVVEDRGAGATP